MLRSPTRRCLLLLACLVTTRCASDDTVTERTYAPDEFSATGPSARIELVRAAYLPRGVEFKVSVTNLTESELSLQRDGILLAYGGLEYPLDLETDDTPRRREALAPADAMPKTLQLTPGEPRLLLMEFRLGRSMSEPGWVVLRGLGSTDGFRDPLWLEVPPAPARKAAPPLSRPVR